MTRHTQSRNDALDEMQGHIEQAYLNLKKAENIAKDWAEDRAFSPTRNALRKINPLLVTLGTRLQRRS